MTGAIWRVPAFALAAAMMPGAALAQDDGLSANAEIRARVESIDGQFRPGVADTTALLLRTDIGVAYTQGPFTIGGELIDSRAYFEKTRSSVSTTEVNTLEPVQAYIGVKLGNAAKATLGRFVLNLGSRRLVARNNYRNTVNGFTGAKLELGNATTANATLFWTMPQTRLPDARNDIENNVAELDRERIGLQFFGAIGALPLGASRLEGYVYRLSEDDAPGLLTRDRKLWTLGVRNVRAPGAGHTDYEVEGAYQFGRSSDTTAVTSPSRSVSAWTAHASAGFTWDAAWKPRLSAAFDGASGDRSGGKQTRFDPLFGARAFDFGPTSLYGPVSRGNILGATARLEVVPTKRLDAYLALQHFWLDSATDSFGGTGVRSATGEAGHDAGTQLDMRVRYWLKPKRLRLDGGFATLFKDRFLAEAENAPNDSDTHYGYLELVLTI